MEAIIIILLILILVRFKVSFYPSNGESEGKVAGGYSETPYTEYEDEPQETTQWYKGKIKALSHLEPHVLFREKRKYMNLMLAQPYLSKGLVDENHLYFQAICLEIKRREL